MTDEKHEKRPAMQIMGRLPLDTRPIDEQLADIEREGMAYTASTMRLAFIGGMQMRPRDWPKTSENLIILGCATWGTPIALTSYCQLLQRLGEQYVFLRKEYCCGAPLMARAHVDGTEEERKRADLAAQDFTGRNIAGARELGAKTMYHCCTWCAYLAVRFHGESDVPQRYYMDHVVEAVERKKPKLKLKRRIAYFPGGQHRRVVYVPGINWNFDWQSYRTLLDKVEGLEVVDIPRYCCVTSPDAINNAVLKNSLDTLVTTCQPCYGRMMRKAPKGIRVMTIPELLLEALQDDPEIK